MPDVTVLCATDHLTVCVLRMAKRFSVSVCVPLALVSSDLCRHNCIAEQTRGSRNDPVHTHAGLSSHTCRGAWLTWCFELAALKGRKKP